MPPDLSWLDQLLEANKARTQPYNQQVSPVATPANPTGVGTGGTTAPTTGVDPNAMAQIFSALAQHLSNQDQQANARIQQGTDLLQGRHLGVNGLPVSTVDPFGGAPTFKSAGERYADMSNGTGAYTPTNAFATATTRNNMRSNNVAPPAVGTVQDRYLPDMSALDQQKTRQTFGPKPPQRKNRYSIL